jgi:hypothetical protein
MNKEFILYEQALALKKLGFDKPCFGYYNTTWSKQNELLFPQYAGELENWNEMTHLCSAPTFSQAFRWFREKHGIASHMATYWQHDWNNYSYQYYFVEDKIEWNGIEHYKTYEEAELECLKKLIKIVKEKQQ